MLQADIQPLSKANPVFSERKFSFHALEDFRFKGFHDKSMQEQFYKWGLRENSYLRKFTFDQFLQPYEVDQFLMEFFNDALVNGQIKVMGTFDRWGSLGTVSKIEKEETAHSVTSLSFFDKLYKGGKFSVLIQMGLFISKSDSWKWRN